jgi:hypothetical protein
MIFLHTLSIVLGAAIVAAVLGSALKTVVLPEEGFPRLSQAVFALVHRILVRRWDDPTRRSSLRSFYAPVALVSLPLVWMILIAIGVSFVFFGIGSLGWQRALEDSMSSLTTLGFSEPSGMSRIVIAFIEATIGLGLVALLISYLPTIYAAYNSREKGINLLSPLAGVPPNVTDLLQTLHRTGALDSQDFWRRQSDWLVEAEQTHTAFPILSSFPEARAGLSWVASVGVVLDAAALVVSASESQVGPVLDDKEKGPLMALVYGTPAVDRIARAAAVPLPTMARVPDVVGHAGEPAPPISVTRQEYLDVLANVGPVIGFTAGREEQAWQRFARMRATYDKPLRALAGLTHAAPAPWTTDRPARVGRPRFLRRRPLAVDWDPGATATTRGG